VIARFTDERREALPVVDGDGRYRGTVTARQVEEAMRDNVLDVTVGELAQQTATLAADQTLERALGMLVRMDSPGLPVLSDDGRSIVGWITHRDVLKAYNDRLERGIERAAGEPGVPPGPVAWLLGVRTPLARLRGYRIVELDVTQSGSLVGRRVVDLAWPPHCLVLAVRREDQTFEPSEETEMCRGDRLSVLVPAEHADRLADCLRR
jgi:CIC family chloride channel protein